MNDELLSEVIATILEFEGLIIAAQKDIQIVAYSFEPPSTLIPTWELAVEFACKFRPQLNIDDARERDWSINLFTTDGLWQFPK